MRQLHFIFLSLMFINTLLFAQQKEQSETLPYYQIPDYPEEYTEEAVLARVIDGLGFRYYWASKDLREEDLNYSPGNDGRTTRETLDHILGRSFVVYNAAMNKPNVRLATIPERTWEETRRATLGNIKKASDHLKSGKADKADKADKAKDLKMIFQRGEGTSEFPLWNLLNGHLSDAIYHTGQIASHRRSSGNPIDPGISMLSGKVRE